MIRDSRRVPGPSLWNDGPAVALDVLAPPGARGDGRALAAAWRAALDRLWPDFAAACRAAGGPALGPARAFDRPYDGGATVGFAAPLSVLYEAAELNELAAGAAEGGTDPDSKKAAALGADAARAYRPALEALRAEAVRRGRRCLVGEGVVTVGSGPGARSFALGDVPDPSAVDWAAVSDVPLALVTGTNGKTTTTRLVTRMLAEAGLAAGYTSTEGVHVGADTLVAGDFAGPEGARRLLRDPRVGAAVLETSRGGMLRRGLAATGAAVAVVTNVGADHFGDYGILTVPDVALAKLTIRKGLAPGAPLVLNADDPALARAADALGLVPVWFGLAPDGPRLGPTAAFVRDGAFVLRADGVETALGAVDAAPLTFGGTARHNVQNALGAALVAHALGVPVRALAAALAAFGRDPADNPGRLNVHRVGGATVVVDYGHNDDGIAAVLPVLQTFPATRRRVLLSQAGDRSDADNARMAAALAPLAPDEVMVTELPGYERGRAAGETSESLARGFAAGVPGARLRFADRPGAGAAALLDDLRAGDLVVLFLHADRAEVLDRLGQMAG